MNKGKKLEQKIKQACEEQFIDFTRLRDAGYQPQHGKIEKIRFTPKNICDCILFKNGVILFAEIKRREKSIAFKDITQLEDLQKKWKPDEGVYSGVIIELEGILFFLSTDVIDRMIVEIGKKSFNKNDADHYGLFVPQEIPQGKRTSRPNIGRILNYLRDRWSLAA